MSADLEFRRQLLEADSRIGDADLADIPHIFDRIPLETFGAIQIDRPDWLPNLNAWLPQMASDEVQVSWTGSSGHVLLKQSVSFVRIVTAAYSNITGRSLGRASVLDFGCGWGRLIRLFYKYIPTDRIYAVDPMEKSLAYCAEAGLYGTFLKSDFIPRTLPTPSGLRFDFIFAFSVFTHLSPKVTSIALKTLGEHLTDDGVLAITIRPREYWTFAARDGDLATKKESERLSAEHDRTGMAFAGHHGQLIEGEVTYGDSSISLDYLEAAAPHLRVVGMEWSVSDIYQVIVFLRRRV